jgi:hypothetical protein
VFFWKANRKSQKQQHFQHLYLLLCLGKWYVCLFFVRPFVPVNNFNFFICSFVHKNGMCLSKYVCACVFDFSLFICFLSILFLYYFFIHLFKKKVFLSSPIVRVAVETENPSEMPKLVEVRKKKKLNKQTRKQITNKHTHTHIWGLNY